MFGILIAMVMVFGLTATAHATLWVRGTDTLGNQLIYDSDLDITWYDYSKGSDPFVDDDTWQYQVGWASTLTVDYGGTIYGDWRLPTADTTCGTTSNCIGSEMGHLYYTELENTAGGTPGGGLSNTGYFENLLAATYWTGTQVPLSYNAYFFNMGYGTQFTNSVGTPYYALAVLDGNVPAAVPEPSTLLLLGGGLAGLGLLRRLKRRAH